MFSFAAGVRIALSRDKSVRNSPFDKSNMFFLFNQIYHCLCQKLTLKCPLIGSLLISRVKRKLQSLMEDQVILS